MNAMQEVLPFLNEAIWHGFFVFLRVAAVAALLPAFGEQAVPARIKLVIAMAFTLVVAPILQPFPTPENISALYPLVLSEALSGLILGIGVRLFILALQTAGSIAAQCTSLSQVLGGAAVDPLPAMGYILVIAGMALAVMMGLHLKAVQLIFVSYEFLPFGRFSDGSVVTDWGVEQISRAFSLAFTLAAPFVILSVLYNVALGAINRAMPQLMVAFVGAPLITAGGLALLLVSAPYMLMFWLDTMDHFLADPFGPIP